ncbi:MAG: hypothetical protein QOF04_706, partial [Solirubrobacteraceae bacterium]|nr:hypothetical protein [Solirubrobacteraceae bacterium]
MAETTEQRVAAVREVAQSVQGLDAAAQQAAMAAVIAPPDSATTNELWLRLVTGLLLLLALALGGV